MTNMELWNKVKQPPKEALKEITGGRLKGMTDIKPQWRYKALTEIYGPCGQGWVYEIKRTWSEIYSDEIIANVEVLLYIGDGKGIPGIGSSKISTVESKGVYVCDEAYKMATTDALSVACKMLGIGADVYMGKCSSSKYPTKTQQLEPKPEPKPPLSEENLEVKKITGGQKANIYNFLSCLDIENIVSFPKNDPDYIPVANTLKSAKITSVEDLDFALATRIEKFLNAKHEEKLQNESK